MRQNKATCTSRKPLSPPAAHHQKLRGVTHLCSEWEESYIHSTLLTLRTSPAPLLTRPHWIKRRPLLYATTSPLPFRSLCLLPQHRILPRRPLDAIPDLPLRLINAILLQESRPAPPDRKTRKSVVFDSEVDVVEADGKVTTMATTEETKDSAQSHAPSTPPLSVALGAFTNNAGDAPVEEQTPATEDGLDLSMMKKKKKKSKKTEEDEGEGADGAADETAGLDLTVSRLASAAPPPSAALVWRLLTCSRHR